MSKYLITGSASQVGHELLLRLKDDAAPRPREALDVTNYEAVNNQIASLRPECVIHTAAARETPDSLRCWNVNVLGASNVARSCLENGVPLIFLSTNAVFGGNRQHTEPYTETDPVFPSSLTGQTKIAAEHQIMQLMSTSQAWRKNMRWWILRCGHLFERPWRYGTNSVFRAYQSVPNDSRVIQAPRKLTSYCYVPHLVDLLLYILRNTDQVKSGVYHVANTGAVTTADLLAELGRVAPRHFEVTPAAAQGSTALDCREFAKASGFPLLPSWQEAIRTYARELKALGH